MNLKELLKLAGKEGKVVFVGDDGQVKGVFMGGDSYLKTGEVDQKKLKNQRRIEDAIERVNKAILESQLDDDLSSLQSPRLETFDQSSAVIKSGTVKDNSLENQNHRINSDREKNELPDLVNGSGSGSGQTNSMVNSSAPSLIGNLLTKRAEEIFSAKPFGRSAAPQYDLRREVMDPDFGKLTEPDDEEIATSFDDI